MDKTRNAEALQVVGKERLRDFQTLNNKSGLLFFAAHLMLTLMSGILVWLAQGSVWLLPALLLHGIVLVHWFAPLHECVHGTAFRNHWLNDAVAWWSGLIIMIVPTHFKYEHVAHHAYTADVEKDPERIPQADTLWGYLYYATAIPYFKGLISVLTRLPFGRFTAEERRFIPRRLLAKARRDAIIMWIIYLTLALASLWWQSWAILTYWLIPRIVAEPLMRLIRMSEHGACEQVPEMLRNTRTVMPSLPVRLLAWNMCYHVEHHSLPRVPFHALPQLHALLKPNIRYLNSSYWQAQRDIIRHGLRSITTSPTKP